MKVLVTGAAGYIGSHTIIELIKNNHHVEGIDNFSNSKKESLIRVEKITNTSITNHQIDIRNKQDLFKVFSQFKPDAVVHFAGLKSVAESVENPELYYENNIGGTENLLSAMKDNDCRKIVFSSSATVYGHPQYLPINELHSLNPVNPYGESKLKCEQLIEKWSASNKENAAKLFKIENSVVGNINKQHEPTAIKDSVSGKLVMDPTTMNMTVAKFCKELLTNQRPSKGFEIDLIIKRRLQKGRINEKILN